MKRLFVDMDGTLAEWRKIKINIDKFEDARRVQDILYKILKSAGYYRTLKPHVNVVKAIKELTKEDDIEVFICSCYIPDCRAKVEKEDWLKEYLPEIDKEHMLFVPDGEDKTVFIPGGVKEGDFLLDDYTKNLLDFNVAGGVGIKLLNNVNESKGSWFGNKVSFTMPEEQIKDAIKDIVLNDKFVVHDSPAKDGDLLSPEDLPIEFEY